MSNTFKCEQCQVEPVLEKIEVKRHFLQTDYRYVCPICGKATKWYTEAEVAARVDWNGQVSVRRVIA